MAESKKPENYNEHVNKTLMPQQGNPPYRVIDLFAGCGGLSLGFEAQGFATIGYEINEDCCHTYNENLHGHCNKVFLTEDTILPKAPVVIGGPPCQPFSVRGKQKGKADARDGFPAFISAIKRVKPEIWMFENVRGMFYRNKPYFDKVIDQLSALGYKVEIELLNAIQFDVPQNRERVVVVGHKGGFAFPKAKDYKITSGEALGEMAFSIPPDANFLTESMDKYIAAYEKASKCIKPRDLHLHLPARTLTCRNLAGATSDMHRIRLPDGRRRRITAREAARLQSFPDWFQFYGGTESVYNQIGNAVAPFFAYHLAGSIKDYLDSRRERQMSNHKPLTYKTFRAKPQQHQQLILQALEIIEGLGVPLEGLTDRKRERMALAFLAVIDINKPDTWAQAKDEHDGRKPKSREIIAYINGEFHETISDSSYDDIRRKDLRLLNMAGIVINSKPTASNNDSTRGYMLNGEYSPIIRRYGCGNWARELESFNEDKELLRDRLQRRRAIKEIEVTLPSGQIIEFHDDGHNVLQKEIVEKLLKYYGYGAEILYIGDTNNRHKVFEKERLQEFGFVDLEHGKLPDVIAYSQKKKWLYIVEAYYTGGPISEERKILLENILGEHKNKTVYITAFLDKQTFKSCASQIAWETEVWIAENPEHLIHFNGEKFLGPYSSE